MTKAHEQERSNLLFNLDWNKGFNAGAKSQLETDIKTLARLLQDLEKFDGIGEKTAWKIRELFMSAFENKT